MTLSKTKSYLFVGYALILWFLIFIVFPKFFWVAMTLGTLSLIALASLSGSKISFSLRASGSRPILAGILSALGLYAIFYLGNLILGLLPLSHSKWVIAVYHTGSQIPPWAIATLLFFPIGFAEEFFWRHTLQRSFSQHYGSWQGLLLTTFFYVLIHVPTLNPILLVASTVCGLFWGYLFMKTNSFPLVAISHMIWDPLIFIIKPLV